MSVLSRFSALRPTRISIRTTLLLLLLTVFVPLLLLLAAIVHAEWKRITRDELRANMELARAVAATFDGYIATIQQQERLLVDTLQVLPLEKPELGRQVLCAAQRRQAGVLRLDWTSPDGRVLISSDSRAEGRPLAGTRAAWQQVMARPVSPLFLDEQQRRAFNVICASYDARHRLSGALVARVDSAYLRRVLAIRRTGQADFVISDSNGRLVFSSIRNAIQWVETPVKTPIVARVLAGHEESAILPGMSNGELRMGSAVPLRSAGWALAATRPVDEVLAPSRTLLWRYSGWLLLVISTSCAIACWIGMAMARSIRRLHAATGSLGTGGPLPAVDTGHGPLEIRDLARSFQDMAVALQEREQQREFYLHSLSHDLRSPLATVLASVEVLRSPAGQGAEVTRQVLQTIHAAALHMKAMVQDLLDLAELEVKTATRQPVPLPPLLRAVVGTAAAIPAQRLALEVPEDLPPVMANPRHVERTLMNVISNALKYSPTDTMVRVGARAYDGEVLITVSDDGPGIAAEDLPHIFDRYYRARGTRQADGYGLGLYCARTLIEAHGGRIQVDSHPGKGSTFSLCLPATTPTADMQEA